MKYLLIEIIEEIQREADEILHEKQTEYDDGQLLACENLKDYGLDYDIDKKYLL